MTGKASLSAEARIKEAREAAKRRRESSVQSQGPEWPRADDVDLDAALAELCVQMFSLGLKVSAGMQPDGMAIWVRLTIPDDAMDERSGTVAFTVSDTLEKALRKAVQLLESDSPKVWKPNQFTPQRTSSK